MVKMSRLLRKRSSADGTDSRLVGDIDEIQRSLENVRKQYDDVCEDELIEALIYEELSLRARYRYLLRVIRS